MLGYANIFVFRDSGNCVNLRNVLFGTYVFKGGFHETVNAIELIAVTLTSRGGPSDGVLPFIVDPDTDVLRAPLLYPLKA